MTLFKQIIGRGTRIRDDYDKYFFTIIDLKKATELFADSDFDGDPVQIYEPKGDEPPVPPDDDDGEFAGETGNRPEGAVISDSVPPQPGEKRLKYVIDDVQVIVVKERVQYFGSDGKLVTESLKDYTRNSIFKEYASLDAFLIAWTKAKRKSVIINELGNHGVLLDALAEEVGRDLDPFDLVCHIAWGRPALTRRERADNVRKRDYFTKYGDKTRAILDALLDKYADEGIEHIEDINILQIHPLNRLGTPVEIVSAFGGRAQFLAAVRELEAQLYAA